MIFAINRAPRRVKSFIYAEKLSAEDVRTALVRIMRGRGAGNSVINMLLETRVSVFGISQLGVQPYYRVASDKPVTLESYLNFLRTLDSNKLVKAWLLAFGQNDLQHEVALSAKGISIDGRLNETKGITEAIAKFETEGLLWLAAQNYRIGQDAGAIILGQPRELGLEIEPCPIRILRTSSGSVGAVPWDDFVPHLDSLLAGTNLISLSFLQPGLSTLIEKMHLYYDYRTWTFHLAGELNKLTPQPIAEALLGSVFAASEVAQTSL